MERVRLLGAAVLTNAIGQPVVGLHMAECLVDERLTAVAYRRLAQRQPADSPLTELLEDIAETKLAHARIFAAAAAIWVPGRGFGRLFVRHRLGSLRWPLRVARDRGDADALSELYAGAEPQLQELEQDLAASGLPGYRLRRRVGAAKIIGLERGRRWHSIRRNSPRRRDG